MGIATRTYGKYFDQLTLAEQKAALRFIEALEKKYPEIGEVATAGPGHDGTVYVYAPIPDDEDKDIEISEAMAKVSTQLLLDSGIYVLLMKRAPENK